MSDKKLLLEAFLQKPTKYRIEVTDPDPLPKELKGKKGIYFNVKSPVLNVLVESALILEEIPKKERDAIVNGESIADAIKHVPKIARLLALLSWGKAQGVPDWYEPFIMSNVTGKELFDIYYEQSLRLSPSFFLRCFQIAEATNPLTEIKSLKN